jgi:hypothetical protein
MRRALPVLGLLLVALGVLLALRSGPKGALRPDDGDGGSALDPDAPPPAVAGPGPLARAPKIEIRTGPAEEPTGEGDASQDEAAVIGVVVDAETGKPLAGAAVTSEVAGGVCPRPLLRPHPFYDGDKATIVSTTGEQATGWGRPLARTDAEGRFRLPARDGGAVDLYAKAAGHVVGAVCRVSPGVPATIRLEKGLSLAGRVVDRDGRGLKGVRVWTTLPKGVAASLGHDEEIATDAEGRFGIAGLAPGAVVVRAQAPGFVVAVSDPVEAGRRDVVLRLIPAFLVTFAFTTDDGREPDAPTVGWTTTGAPPRTGLEMLSRSASVKTGIGPWPAEGFAPVEIPADRPAVTFEVKALGYSPWTSAPLEIPPDGGSTTIPVELRRDPNLGRLIVRLETREGTALSWVKEGAVPSIWRRDGRKVEAGIVLKPSDVLELPALPAGPWGFQVRSPAYAPAMLETVDVAAGRDTEVRVVLGPPARLRVKFTASERTMVVFRLLLGREVVYPFLENPAPGTSVRGPDEAPSDVDDGQRVIGSEGAILTGLSTGRYTLEVISPELTAPPTSVDLVEGDTKEVEVAVSKR